jgi:hypothetical protein
MAAKVLHERPVMSVRYSDTDRVHKFIKPQSNEDQSWQLRIVTGEFQALDSQNEDFN